MALSTTHVATGSILGSGVGKKGATVRWGVAGRMAIAWVITLPAAAVVGALCWTLAHVIGGGIGVIVVFAILILVSAAIFARSRKAPINHNNVNEEWEGGLVPASHEPTRSSAGISA